MWAIVVAVVVTATTAVTASTTVTRSIFPATTAAARTGGGLVLRAVPRGALIDSGGRWIARESRQSVAGEAVAQRVHRRGFRAYGAGSLEHFHVALHTALVEMRRADDLIENQRVIDVARFGQNPQYSEYNCSLRFRHAQAPLGLRWMWGALLAWQQIRERRVTVV